MISILKLLTKALCALLLLSAIVHAATETTPTERPGFFCRIDAPGIADSRCASLQAAPAPAAAYSSRMPRLTNPRASLDPMRAHLATMPSVIASSRIKKNTTRDRFTNTPNIARPPQAAQYECSL